MANFYTIIFLLCVSDGYGTNRQSSAGTTEFAFTIVGLYSECSTNTNAENRTEMNRVARLTRRYVNVLPFVLANFSRIEYGSQMKIDVHHYDMCSEKGNADVMKILEIMMLDEYYFFQEPGKKYKTSNIGAFFIFMPDNLTSPFKSLVHGIPIFDPNFKEIMQNEYRLYSNFLLKLARLYNWKKLMFFFLEGSDNVFYREYRSRCMEGFKEEYFCVYLAERHQS